MTAAATRPVAVTRAQVRAARELIRLGGSDRVHPVVRQVAALGRARAEPAKGRTS